MSAPEELEASEKTKNSKMETEKPVDEQVAAENEERIEKTQSGEQSVEQAEICEAQKSVETQEAAIEQEAPLSEEPKQVDNKEENATESSTPVETDANKTDSTT